MTDDKTHFGYQQIPTQEKNQKVAAVFNSVATQYDLMNDLMSAGIHRLWKRYTVQLSGVRQGDKVLDLAGGTGDMARLFWEAACSQSPSLSVGSSPCVSGGRTGGGEGQVVLSDINAAMLKIGRDRLLDAGIVQGIDYAQVNAESLPFADNSFDCVCIAFGLRNVTHKERALQSINRVLKPGGRLLVLEFSKPTSPLLQKIYDAYSFSILPKLGHFITGDAASYQYLAESIRMHPDQETLKAMILAAGFDRCEYHNLSCGIVALHRAWKY